MHLNVSGSRSHHRIALFLLFLATFSLGLHCQDPLDGRQFPGMRWRLIGPFRGGRITAVSGVSGDPKIYYAGTPGGGVWKTNDGGQVWHPIFDKVNVPSIGSLAVASSASNVLYVGTGEQTRGRGVYRSADSGATWNRAGLQDVPYIQALIVDPQNPNVVVAGGNSIGFGILWRPIPKSVWIDNRGIFRTEDGGNTWKKVYGNDATLGVVDMCADPGNPRTLYAAVYKPASGSGDSEVPATSDIIKSSDGGMTWAPLVSKGLPEKGLGRMGIVVAPGNSGRRLYAIVEQGFFRSDDGGATWQQSTKDPRILGSPYFSRIFVDSKNPDVLYVAQTSLYRSTDGGATFESFKGAPGGDDDHLLWIDPDHPEYMIMGADQGAVVTMNGGKSWSSWYNQPTGQFYHVTTDDLFPYRVFGAQQDSGTAAVISRSDNGQIQAQDWYSIGGFEYSFIAPDPVNHNFVYSGGWFGTVVRFDKTTSEVATVFERGERYRTMSMPPLVFSPQDPAVLYLGTQFVLKTADGGARWQETSPDLTNYVEKDPNAKPDPFAPPPPAITALSPSPVQAGEIWAGTSNRLVWVRARLRRRLGKCFARRFTRHHGDPLRRCLSSRRSHRVSDGWRYPRIHRSLCGSHPRLWQDLAEDRQRISPGPDGAGGARRSQAQRAALRRNRHRHLRLMGRRRPLAALLAEPAPHPYHRPASPRQRPRRLDLRAQPVDPRRFDARAQHEPAGHCGECVPLCPSQRYEDSLGQLPGHALSQRDAGRPESS